MKEQNINLLLEGERVSTEGSVPEKGGFGGGKQDLQSEVGVNPRLSLAGGKGRWAGEQDDGKRRVWT